MIKDTDIKLIQDLTDQRNSLNNVLKVLNTKDAKIDEWRIQVVNEINPYGSHSYGMNTLITVSVTKELVMYHLKAKLYQVELALKTYGITLS